MPRFTRNRVILAKIETVYGTDSVPTGAANSILMSNPQSKLNVNNVSRDLVRQYFGNSENLAGTKWVENDFDVEMVGSGTAGTAPAWGPLVRGCAMDELVTASIRVDYYPLTDLQKSLSLYDYVSGSLRKSLGARGKLTLSMKQGEIPKFSFAMMGLYGGITAASASGVSFTAFQTPTVVTNTNSTQVTLGSTVNLDALAPVITGGTSYPSLGIEVDFGLDVPLTALVGGETIDVTNRQVTGKITIDVTNAQEVSLEASVLANTVQSVTFLHGTAAGKKVLVYMPVCQFTNPQDSDLNGRLLKSYDLVMVPTSAGNDEIRLICF